MFALSSRPFHQARRLKRRMSLSFILFPRCVHSTQPDLITPGVASGTYKARWTHQDLASSVPYPSPKRPRFQRPNVVSVPRGRGSTYRGREQLLARLTRRISLIFKTNYPPIIQLRFHSNFSAGCDDLSRCRPSMIYNRHARFIALAATGLVSGALHR